MSVSAFDKLINIVSVEDEHEETFELEDSEKSLLAWLQRSTPPRYTTPTYEPPEIKSDYEKSAPFPSEFKVSVEKRKGIIESYLTVYDDPTTGQEFIDSYNDVVERGSFKSTIATLETTRQRRNDPHLVPYLWQHSKHEPIGGVVSLKEESKGIVYAAQIVQSIRRGAECLDLMEQKILGSSYGYDPVRFQHKGDIRHLIEIRLHEISACTFPANPHATVIGVKSQFFVPGNYRVNALKEIEKQGEEIAAAYNRVQKIRELDHKANDLWTRLACQAGSILREWQ